MYLSDSNRVRKISPPFGWLTPSITITENPVRKPTSRRVDEPRLVRNTASALLASSALMAHCNLGFLDLFPFRGRVRGIYHLCSLTSEMTLGSLGLLLIPSRNARSPRLNGSGHSTTAHCIGSRLAIEERLIDQVSDMSFLLSGRNNARARARHAHEEISTGIRSDDFRR